MKPMLYLNLLCFSLSTPVWANLPIKIESDQASYFQKEGKMVHEGHVVVHWGDRILHADRLILVKNEQGQVQSLKAFGHPALFEGQTEGKNVHGQANTIEYKPDTHLIYLEGDAKLNHQSDKFMGPWISLNTQTSEISARRSTTERPLLIFENFNK